MKRFVLKTRSSALFKSFGIGFSSGWSNILNILSSNFLSSGTFTLVPKYLFDKFVKAYVNFSNFILIGINHLQPPIFGFAPKLIVKRLGKTKAVKLADIGGGNKDKTSWGFEVTGEGKMQKVSEQYKTSCNYTWSDVDKESDDEIPDILDITH